MVAGRVNGVVQGRASAGPLLQDGVANVAGVTREIPDDLRAVVERHQERLVLSAAQGVKYEIDGGVLLEFQALAYAVGRIQHHADAQRKIGRLAERGNFLLDIIVERLEIFLIQIGDEFFVLGHHAEQHFHQVDVPDDRALPVHLRRAVRLRLRRRLRLLRAHDGHGREKTKDCNPKSPFFHCRYTYGASAASISAARQPKDAPTWSKYTRKSLGSGARTSTHTPLDGCENPIRAACRKFRSSRGKLRVPARKPRGAP